MGRGIKKLLKLEISCDRETISTSPSGQLGLPACPLCLTCDVWCDCANVRRFSGEHLRTLSALGSFKGAALMFGREGLTCTSVVSAFTSLQADRRILSRPETVSGLQDLKVNHSCNCWWLKQHKTSAAAPAQISEVQRPRQDVVDVKLCVLRSYASSWWFQVLHVWRCCR